MTRQSVISLIVVSALAGTCAVAQITGIGERGKTGGNIQVRVVEASDRPVQDHLQVDLLTDGGMIISAALTNSNGMAFFSDVAAGSYRVRVTGTNIQDSMSGVFFIDSRGQNHSEILVVQPRTPKSAISAPAPAIAMVDLDIPKPARKAVEKGVEAFNQGNLEEARKHFETAIEKYPNYASAYNFLGVTLIQQKDTQRGQQALEKAIELNDHLADAYTNLAKIYFRQQNFAMCESLLLKSLASEPRSAEALTYLTQVQLLGGKYDEAAQTARRVHEMPHPQYAVVHFMAARALRARKKYKEAVAEYKLFLQESPNTANSSQARQELVEIENQKP